MHRYNDEGQMIDTDTINKSLLAQEIIINFINKLLDDESCGVDNKEGFTLGLYASQYQMKFKIEESIKNNQHISEFEQGLLSLLRETEKKYFGKVIEYDEMLIMIDSWIETNYPNKIEK